MTARIEWRSFDLPGADVRLTQFCDEGEAARWFARLHAGIPWERHRLRLFGREIDSPRLSCWIGDSDAAYAYSGTRFAPRAWTPALDELKKWLFAHCGERCNGVLANLYRDGRDSMGWHSDDEPELGAEPVILSFSFGGVRRFRLRHRCDPRLRLELDLPSGSLLRLAGGTQRHYRHDLPKTARAVAARINLTFRRVRAARR
ncbi:MAG: alpha-ketoglutarate-dependent dioxygenase AlkB [Rudaea sp.]|uniref:alpha-ketoglutarate-dependent dioxygenase AlkB family protein n=1 Tax=Rudaea sp. TaxID=2136325 RepID=UPI0039E380C0